MPRSLRAALHNLAIAVLVLLCAACIDLTGVYEEMEKICMGSCPYTGDNAPGLPPTDIGTLPAAVAGGLSFTAVSVGADHACGVSTDGVHCWGQVPHGPNAYQAVNQPALVPATTGIDRIASGGGFACGL